MRLIALLGIYSDPARDARGHTVTAVYVGEAAGTPEAADDAKNCRLFSLNELSEPLAFDITTYCLLWFVFGFNTLDQQTLFQSGWFIEGLLSQTLIVHMIRTRKILFFQSFPGWPLLVMTVLVMGLASFCLCRPLPITSSCKRCPWIISPGLQGFCWDTSF